MVIAIKRVRAPNGDCSHPLIMGEYRVITGFGPHYRVYRLVAALDRLGGMPPGTTLSVSKAAHLLGISEANLHKLITRYGPQADPTAKQIGAATLRHVIRQAYNAHKQARG